MFHRRNELCPKLDPGVCGCGVAEIDSDGDGTPDCIDPCPGDNPNDSDGDGVCDSADFCPGGNDQLNDDGDPIPSCVDNCPSVANPDQVDTDGDQAGDHCDCGVEDPGIFPNAWEINDGRENQCPGDACHGLIDETSGDSGFHDTGALISCGLEVGRHLTTRQIAALKSRGRVREVMRLAWTHGDCLSGCVLRGDPACRW